MKRNARLFKTLLLSYEEQRARVLEQLRRTIRPKLLNRLDDIIVFEPLAPKQLREIV